MVGTGQMTDALCFLALNHAQRARGEAQSWEKRMPERICEENTTRAGQGMHHVLLAL